MRGVEFLKAFGMFGRFGPVADVLSYDGAIFTFHQSVVGSPIGPRFGELDPQFLQQGCHSVIDEFRAVIAVESEYKVSAS